MNILVLYTRLTGYWMACMRKDCELNNNNYLVYRKTPSKDAPFKIESEPGIKIRDYASDTEMVINSEIANFKPDLIYIAGWTNKHYLKIAKTYKSNGIPVITGMDNQWLGTLKQRIASLFSYTLIRKYVTYIWVPGKPQYYYARKLGFKPQHILTGLYCADESIFEKVTQTKHVKQFIFVGRVVDHKGVENLFEVVDKLLKSNDYEFKLHVIGSGPLEHLIPKHPNVKHTPFVDPEKIPELLTNAGTFILPSLYEAWGVVVHEAALAGLPMVSTHQCGAATELLIDGFNGYTYNATDKDALTRVIKKLVLQDEQSYFKMSANSKYLASNINLTRWAAQINSVVIGN
ncbi:glycosyltransferase [Winogradskyella endarachnes]|uniref:Glycosyltransferase n=1 Tax=Winogradskyella endarachnes TaxID=2681965 RepID=A0A6L6UAD8_9FLAO|nr:glycosyltransferase [Winogradskyella endarachnes]MUU77877.1 glycosyltransferase [Winogradskyella endarachnes]